MRQSTPIRFLMGGIGLAAVVNAAPTGNNSTTMVTDWSQITPSPNINWVPCFQNFTCTRLEVPLDYEDPSVGNIAVAFIKDAAQNETKNTKNVLYNPGGPGGSGVDVIIEKNKLRQRFGPNYNIIGFDPRGVKHSGPNIDCFNGDLALSYNFFLKLGQDSPDLSAEYFNGKYELYGAYGELCGHNLKKTAGYVGTAAVAKDMLTFTEKQAIANGENPEDAKVWYYGISYGSILGATFATIFPDRVGRVAIDAIANGDDYYNNQWSHPMEDSDRAIQSFFKYCHEAGQDRCVYYEDTAEKIEQRFRKLRISLKDNPIAVWDQAVTQIPSFATYSMLQAISLRTAYDPQNGFPWLAQVLVDLEKRNGTSLLSFSSATLAPCYNCSTDALEKADSQPWYMANIYCIDADGRGNISTKEAWREYMYGAGWAPFPLMCRKYPFRSPPSQKFDGKFGANTSAPLLVLSNEIDPVTPLANARKMQSLFPSSGLIVQPGGVGHGTLAAVTDCANKLFQQYFDEGKVPPANTTCVSDVNPFLQDVS